MSENDDGVIFGWDGIGRWLVKEIGGRPFCYSTLRRYEAAGMPVHRKNGKAGDGCIVYAIKSELIAYFKNDMVRVE